MDREFERKTRTFFLSNIFTAKREKGGGAGKNRAALRVVLTAVAVLSIGFGSYMVVYSYFESKQVDPVTAIRAMEKLRGSASNQEGFTVDQLMTAEIDRFKRENNVKGYQGWHTKRIHGTDSKVVVVFSFQDQQNQSHVAEWLVDVNTQDFAPQTDLARSVYGR